MSVRIVFLYNAPTDRNTWFPRCIWLDIFWSIAKPHFKRKLVTEVYLTAEGTSITPAVSCSPKFFNSLLAWMQNLFSFRNSRNNCSGLQTPISQLNASRYLMFRLNYTSVGYLIWLTHYGLLYSAL